MKATSQSNRKTTKQGAIKKTSRNAKATAQKAKTIGIDTSKSVFQVHGVDEHDNVVFRKRLKRDQFLDFFAQLPPAKIGVEASGAPQYWARKLIKPGHNVRLMDPRKVKPYRDNDHVQ